MLRPLASLATILLSSIVFQAGEVKHEDVLQKMLGSLQQITKTLEGVTDNQSAEAAQPELKKQAQEFRDTRKRSEELPPPMPEERDRIAKEWQPKFVKARKELVAEIARVQRVPGGKESLQEIRDIFDKDKK